MKKRTKFLPRLGIAVSLALICALSVCSVTASAEASATETSFTVTPSTVTPSTVTPSTANSFHHLRWSPSLEREALDTDADNGYILLNEKSGGKVENTFLLTDETNSEVENSSLLSGNTDGEVENTYQSTDETSTEQDTGAEDNPFSLIYDKIINGADEIFSIITCALSFALMIIYKKGMMPTLEGGVRSLAVSVKGIGEKATEIKSATDSFASDIADRLAAAEKSLTELADGVNKLTATLDEREKSSYSKDDLTTVMLAEIDMLYEIFNSAELPQYLKEHVGERINEMKKTLKKKDNPNE